MPVIKELKEELEKGDPEVWRILGRIVVRSLLEELENDPIAWRRLVGLMVTDEDVRNVIINAVRAEVVSRGDLERLRNELRQDFDERLQNDVEKLEERIRSLKGDMDEIKEDVDKLKSSESSTRERLAKFEGKVDILVAIIVGIVIAVISQLLLKVAGIM